MELRYSARAGRESSSRIEGGASITRPSRLFSDEFRKLLSLISSGRRMLGVVVDDSRTSPAAAHLIDAPVPLDVDAAPLRGTGAR